jgi:hypothetical protein
MLRYASLILCAVASLAIAAGISISGYADDNQKPVAGKDPAAKGDSGKKQPRLLKPDERKKYDLGDIEETPPPELEVDPTLEKPAARPEQAKVAGEDRFGGLGGRGSGHRAALVASGGGNKDSERAVTAALIWLANHQAADGSWSIQQYTQRCIDKTCTGPGTVSADAGATAMGLLPFLAAGQTHKSKGPYKEHIARAISWLLKQQQPDGNLAKGVRQMMYSHGLATIALAESYGMSGDKQVGQAVQRAIDFIVAAQNHSDGGWRYNPGDAGDTSVVGWQLMALKSAHMAGLTFGGHTFMQTSKWLDSVAVNDGTEYSYQPGVGPANTMTSVGLLCRQYLGAHRDNPMLVGGTKYLMAHLPDERSPNIYYWYYATQVLHNMSGKDWETWNSKMRDLLVRAQVHENTCAKGSWNPAGDAWGRHGGRLMVTSLSTLTLEIYYRYLPLFKPDVAPVPKKE